MSSPPERYRIKCQAASHPGAAFLFAALAHSRHARTARRIPTEPSRLCHAMSRLPPQAPHHSPRSHPTLLWYTGTLRGEIAVIRNSPCEIAVFRPQNDHLARGIPDNGYFNPCFGAWRRLSGLGMVSLRSRGLSGLMPAGPHVWVTSAARGPTSRVSWLYAHISELPDDSSRIVKIPVVHAHHADRILRHALLAFPFLIHYFANFPA